MSLIDLRLQRRSRFFGSPSAARYAVTVHPQVEVLEERCCPSVAAPTGLQLSAVSPTQVKLTWVNPVGSLGTRVYAWNGTAQVLVTQLAKGVTTYTAINLQPNQTQWFSVQAYDQTTSAQSAWSAIMTPANAITVPTNLHVGGAAPTQISLAWTNATGATGYRIYGWNGTSAILLGTATPNNPSFVASGLAQGTTYYFYVQAFNATNSASTNWLTASTTATGVTAPTNVQTNVLNANTVALSWKDSAGETGYKVYQWDGVASHSPTVIATLAANTTGYQAVGLLPGTQYSFYVQAFNNSITANSPWVTATTTTAAPLQPPTQLVVQADGTTSALISWTQPARATGYVVYVWTGVTWSQVGNLPAGTHQFDVTGLKVGQTNWLMVESYTGNFAEVAYSSAVFVNL